MTSPKAPAGLAAGGRSLWRGVVDNHDLEPAQLVQLEEACRAKDRLDKLDRLLRGDVGTWTHIDVDTLGAPVSLRVDAALGKANDTANLLKQLIAALRLPDAVTGKKPQYHGPRGAQAPTVPGGSKVSSLDRARAAKSS